MDDDSGDGTGAYTRKKNQNPTLFGPVITIELLESEYNLLQYESSLEQLEQHARALKQKCIDYQAAYPQKESEKIGKLIIGLNFVVDDKKLVSGITDDDEVDVDGSVPDPIDNILSGTSRPELPFESLYPVSCFTDAQTFDWILIPQNNEYRDNLSEIVTEFKNIKANIALWKREKDGSVTFQGVIRKPTVPQDVNLSSDESALQKRYVTDGFVNIIEADESDLKNQNKTFNFQLNDQCYFRKYSLPKRNIDNCYYIFNTTTEKAYQDIKERINNQKIRDYLLIAVEDAILSNDFVLYLSQNQEKFKTETDFDKIKKILKGHEQQQFNEKFFDFANSDLVIKIYLHYQFNVSKQWPHPGILYCLAELNDKHLFLYSQKTHNEITEHPSFIAPKKNDKAQIHLLFPDENNHFFDVLEAVKQEPTTPTPKYFIAQTENEYSLNYSNTINIQKQSKTQGLRRNFNHSYNPFHPDRLRLAGIHELIDHLDFLVFLKHDTNKGKISDQAISLHCLAIEKTIEEILLSFSFLERNPLLAAFLLKKEDKIEKNPIKYLEDYKKIVLTAIDLYPNIKDGINADENESNLKKLWQIKKDSNYRYVETNEKHFHNKYIVTKENCDQNPSLPPDIQDEESRFIKLKLLSAPDGSNKNYDVKIKSETKTISLYTERSSFKEKLRTALVFTTTFAIAAATGFLAFYFIGFAHSILMLSLLTATAFIAAGALAYLVSDKLTQDIWKKRFRNIQENAHRKINEVENKLKQAYQNLISPKKNIARKVQTSVWDIDSDDDKDNAISLDMLDKVKPSLAMSPQTPVLLLQEQKTLTALRDLLEIEKKQHQPFLSQAALVQLDKAIKKFIKHNPIVAQAHRIRLNSYQLEIKQLLLLPEDSLLKDELIRRAEELVENMKKFISELDKAQVTSAMDVTTNKRREVQPQVTVLPQKNTVQSNVLQTQAVQNPPSFNDSAIQVAKELNTLFSEKKEIINIDKSPANPKLSSIRATEKKLNKKQKKLFNLNFQIMPLHHWKNYVEHREAGIEAYQRKIDGVNKKLLEIHNANKRNYQSDVERINQCINSDEVNLEDLVAKLDKLENRLKENNCIPTISKNAVISSRTPINQDLARDNFNQQIEECNEFIKTFGANLPKVYKELRDKVFYEVYQNQIDYAALTNALRKLVEAFTKASKSWNQPSVREQQPVMRSPTKRNLLKTESGLGTNSSGMFNSFKPGLGRNDPVSPTKFNNASSSTTTTLSTQSM